MKLSCIVPCYNEEGGITAFHAQASATLAQAGYPYELLYINDGSSDTTLQKLREIAGGDTHVRIISFSRNFGKEAAMYAGLQHAKGDYVAIIDADLQQSPSLLLKMAEILDTQADVDCVAAYQKNRKESRGIVFLKNLFYKLINRVAEIEFISGASDFRMMRRNMVAALLEMTEYYRFSKGLFSWVGFSTHYMEYEADARVAGTSKFSFWKLVKLAIEGLVSFTTAPLRIATVFGSVIAAASVIYMVVVVIQKLFFSIDVPGYATIVVLILLLGGMQLFFLGIIGEYLARTYIQTKNRPVYIIKEKIGLEQEPDEQAE